MPDFPFEATPPNPDSAEDESALDPPNWLSQYRRFATLLRQGALDDPQFPYLQSCFVDADGLGIALRCQIDAPEDVDAIVKMPDLVANAHKGKMDSSVEQLCARVWTAIHGTRVETADRSPMLPDLFAKFCLNYGMLDSVAAKVVKDSLTLAQSGRDLDELLSGMTPAKRESVIKVLVSGAEDSRTLVSLVSRDMASECKPIFEKLLTRTRNVKHAQIVTCYLGCQLSADELISMLLSTLQLWADPVIAKAYVTNEIIHVTKAAFLLFCNIQPKDLLRRKTDIVGMLVRGLPNHFNSTDGRTVSLAHFFSKLLTDTLTYYEDGTEIPKDVSEPEDELARQVLDAFVNCDETKHFWLVDIPWKKLSEMNVDSSGGNTKSKNEAAQDSDDDDDALDDDDFPAPKSTVQVKYIRHFLETLPELSNWDDVLQAFSALPDVIKRQLSLEHPRVGVDLLECVFNWENQFEDPKLDELRKTSLCTVLREVPEGNAERLLEFFHGEHVQPYRKALILDVVSKVSKDLSLKDLQHVTRCTFRKLLVDDFAIARQDVTVRIPFVLTLSRLLCLLPEPMVEEFMVVEYLSALRSMGQVDAATEQTVCYALSQVMGTIGQYKITPAVQDGMKNTRDWLVAVQNAR